MINTYELNKKFDKVSVDALVGSVEFVVSENDNRNCQSRPYRYKE